MSFKPVTASFAEANSELERIAEAIESKTSELVSARQKHLESKAFYEKEYSRYLLETKIASPAMVQSEITAQAKILSYQAKLDSIIADSAYMKLLNEIKALRDRLDAAREISFNLRRESQIQ